MFGLRLSVAIAIVVATALMLALIGLSTTSALIELVLFVVGVGAWVFTGRQKNTERVTAEKLRSERGKVGVKQHGGSLLVRDVKASGDVDITQESGNR
jgi:hypothetical protein